MTDAMHDLKVIEWKSCQSHEFWVWILFMMQKIVHDTENSHQENTA